MEKPWKKNFKLEKKQEAYEMRKRVFVAIGRDVGYVPLTTIHSNITDLKERYKDDKFAKVSTCYNSDSTKLRPFLFKGTFFVRRKSRNSRKRNGASYRLIR